MKMEDLLAIVIVGWVLTSVAIWAVVRRVNLDNDRLNEHAEKLEMLMNLKQNKP